ncbi:E3 ubiquitin-protein ligase CHIP [Orchesella cincta]|uniref:E3 ubiquitin-protein ligase CHIP n=1 Tax=Orchesella cincta TaxID=48709 RepID=A0A1D2M6R0_ORCCI|nr:E3 ubiquitin-protein ligase CHIP [Orchesella cincta]
MASSQGAPSRGCKRSFSEMTAFDLIEEGHRHRSASNFVESMRYYSGAISKNLKIPTFFTYRAAAAFMLNRFDEAATDSRRALELQPEMVYGHFLLGRALCSMNKFDEGLCHIQQAIELGKQEGGYYDQNMIDVLIDWQKQRLEIFAVNETAKEQDLKSFLSRLIQDDKKAEICKINSPTCSRFVVKEDGETFETEVAKAQQRVEERAEANMTELHDLFMKLDISRANREAPDYFCGKITLDVLRNPVITPSGITYERETIEEHLSRNGPTDPMTGEPVTVAQLIPNLALQEAVNDFVQNNPWALL